MFDLGSDIYTAMRESRCSGKRCFRRRFARQKKDECTPVQKVSTAEGVAGACRQ